MVAGHRIDPDLAAEKQLVLIAKAKVEDACIFQEKLTLLWNKDFEGCDVERLQIDFCIGEIRIPREIQNQIGSKTVFQVNARREREFGVLTRLLVIPGQSVRLHDEEPSAADIFNAA